jgi:alcohol dehydrogenase
VTLTRSTPAAGAPWADSSSPTAGGRAIDLRPGETVVVNGATGGFGSAGVAVALAMGAATVVATGRNQRALDDLAARLSFRVRPAAMTGAEADDRARIIEAAEGPIDGVLDLLPRMATPSQVRTALLSVRPGGRVVLMGGVGRTGGADLELSYSWLMHHDITVRGKWMYPRDAPAAMIRLVRAGFIDLDLFDVSEFPIADANEAIAHAATNAGPCQLTVLRLDRIPK